MWAPPMTSLARRVAVPAAVAVIGLGGCGSTSPPTATSKSPTQFFATDSPFNTKIARKPTVAADSAAIVRLLEAHPPVADIDEFGVAVFQADGSTPRRIVTCRERWGSCPAGAQRVPIPDGATPPLGADSEMVVVNRSEGHAYEFWQARRSPSGSWSTSSLSIISYRGDGRAGETGAGVSQLAGLVLVDDVRSGAIDHALSFSSDITCRGRFVYPARKTDGQSTLSTCIPEGARIQLDPTVNLGAISGLTPIENMMGTALQRYGAYVRDTGGARIAFSFQRPPAGDQTYAAAGLPYDYAALPHLPWQRLRVLSPGDER